MNKKRKTKIILEKLTLFLFLTGVLVLSGFFCKKLCYPEFLRCQTVIAMKDGAGVPALRWRPARNSAGKQLNDKCHRTT